MSFLKEKRFLLTIPYLLISTNISFADDTPRIKLVDQVKEAVYEVLSDAKLIPDTIDPQPGGETTNYASLQKAIGMTDEHIELGGDIRQRLESLLSTIEISSCKLSKLMLGLVEFRKEVRQNMNTLMQEIGYIKQEQYKIKSTLVAHEVSTLNLLDSGQTDDESIITELNELITEISSQVPQPGSSTFTPYDPTADIPYSDCPNCCPPTNP